MSDLAKRFNRFAQLECGESPLYRALALSIASDSELLRIASRARHGPVPNLFLAAVHDLLLRGRGEDLACHYRTIAGTRVLPPEDAPPSFRTFVLAEQEAMTPLLEQRLVQTNEVRRAAMVRLALMWIRSSYDVEKLALVEAGTSAGLLLAFDGYRYRLTSEKVQPGFVIETEPRGDRPVPRAGVPEIVERIGVDLVTLDLADEADRRWLRALIWGDQPDRLARLDAAIEVAARTPMRLIQGDANELLPGLLDALSPDLPAVVFHSHVLNQFPAAARQRFEAVLQQASIDRSIFRISMEGGDPSPLCTLTVYRGGAGIESRLLARYDAHGAWIEWLA